MHSLFVCWCRMVTFMMWNCFASTQNCTIEFENIVLKRGVPPVLCSLEKEKIVRSSVPISDWALLPQAHSGFWALGAGNRGRNPALSGDGALIWGCAGCPTLLLVETKGLVVPAPTYNTVDAVMVTTVNVQKQTNLWGFNLGVRRVPDLPCREKRFRPSMSDQWQGAQAHEPRL